MPSVRVGGTPLVEVLRRRAVDRACRRLRNRRDRGGGVATQGMNGCHRFRLQWGIGMYWRERDYRALDQAWYGGGGELDVRRACRALGLWDFGL